LYAIRAVTLAWDRRRLVLKVRRAAAHGEIIICDRYPTKITGAMDSPRLLEQPDQKGRLAAFYNRLARFERRLYRDIPPADIVLKLKVSLETAKSRNRARLQAAGPSADNDSDEYLEIRHQQNREWPEAGTKFIHDIDTEQSLDETMRTVKHAIWQAQRRKDAKITQSLPCQSPRQARENLNFSFP
jgi:thymidylate kinase